MIIVVDTGDLQQLGKFYEDNTDLFTRLPVINIDHHTSNSMFGRINLVDIMAPSASEVVTKLIEAFPKGRDLIDEDIATLLLAGVITDTNSFQNSNTTPRAFAAASHLLGYGARQQEIIQNVYKTKNLSTLKLWGRVLTKLRTDEKYKIVWSTITQKDLDDTHSHIDETGDIIDELMTNAPGAEIVLLIKEKEPGFVSVSVRTTHAGVDASELAERFGGGGHVQAAGFRVKGETIEEAEKEVIAGVQAFQKERLYIPEDEEEAATLQAAASMKPAEMMKAEAKSEEIEVPVVEENSSDEVPTEEKAEMTPVAEPIKPAEPTIEMPGVVIGDSGLKVGNDEPSKSDVKPQPEPTVPVMPMPATPPPIVPAAPVAPEPIQPMVTPAATEMSDSMLMKTAEDQQNAKPVKSESEPEKKDLTKKFFAPNGVGEEMATMAPAPEAVTMDDIPLTHDNPLPADATGEVENVQPGVEFDLEPNKMFKIDDQSQ